MLYISSVLHTHSAYCSSVLFPRFALSHTTNPKLLHVGHSLVDANMGMFSKKEKDDDASFHSGATTPPTTAQRTMDTTEKGLQDDGPIHIYNFRVIFMVLIVSLGGLIFGFDTGQVMS